jgi:hypothetical protein
LTPCANLDRFEYNPRWTSLRVDFNFQDLHLKVEIVLFFYFSAIFHYEHQAYLRQGVISNSGGLIGAQPRP